MLKGDTFLRLTDVDAALGLASLEAKALDALGSTGGRERHDLNARGVRREHIEEVLAANGRHLVVNRSNAVAERVLLKALSVIETHLGHQVLTLTMVGLSEDESTLTSVTVLVP